MDNYVIMQNMVQAVERASIIIKQDFEAALANKQCARVEKTSATILPDFVTETDGKAEAEIKQSLAQTCPDIAFVGEECGGDLTQDEFFLVDPLDGTSNFAALRNYFAICAAYIKNEEVLAAVIADPVSGDIVCAAKGSGTYFNDDRVDLRQADKDSLRYTQLDCELSFSKPADFDKLSKLLPAMSGMRKAGSTALDILNMMRGTDTVSMASGLCPHDIAAALLIIEEAGATATDFAGNRATLKSSELLASAPKKHTQALQLLVG